MSTDNGLSLDSNTLIAEGIEKMKAEESAQTAKPEKTPEEIAAESLAARRKLFEEHPEEFYHQDQIVMAIILAPNGTLATAHGAVPRVMMEQALTRLTYKTMMMFQLMDIAKASGPAEKKSDIIITGTHNGAPVHRKQRR